MINVTTKHCTQTSMHFYFILSQKLIVSTKKKIRLDCSEFILPSECTSQTIRVPCLSVDKRWRPKGSRTVTSLSWPSYRCATWKRLSKPLQNNSIDLITSFTLCNNIADYIYHHYINVIGRICKSGPHIIGQWVNHRGSCKFIYYHLLNIVYRLSERNKIPNFFGYLNKSDNTQTLPACLLYKQQKLHLSFYFCFNSKGKTSLIFFRWLFRIVVSILDTDQNEFLNYLLLVKENFRQPHHDNFSFFPLYTSR